LEYAQFSKPALIGPLPFGVRQSLGKKLISVALFGSYACGDYHSRSDIDLLVIAEQLPAHPKEHVRTSPPSPQVGEGPGVRWEKI
jgi:hypothetical protein